MKNELMSIKLETFTEIKKSSTLWILGAFATDDDKGKIQIKSLNKDLQKQLDSFSWYKTFQAVLGQQLVLNLSADFNILLLGLGKEQDYNREKFRRVLATTVKNLKGKELYSASVVLPSFLKKDFPETELVEVAAQSLLLANYEFNKYKKSHAKKSKEILTFTLLHEQKSHDSYSKILTTQKNLCESINFSRDLTNECPMILTPVEMTKRIVADTKDNLKNVTIKIFDKKALLKDKMNLLLAVNAGSTEEPRLVHLHYSPKKKAGKKSQHKHFSLVGKGVTYDTGGYSLKPANGMAGMKMDMAGAATIYAIFRAAILTGHQGELSCILAITDNKVSGSAIVPDTIIEARSGKTVEILNTDAEGRLILADALDYACDLKPDVIIDAATLTGGMLVALGTHVCGLFSNNDTLAKDLLKSAQNVDEYLWQLPIVQEYRDDMKSKIAEIKNIGSPGKNSSAQGALFLEAFIKNNIPWAHLDIAGVADTQTHLPYCPAYGASGIMIRTVVDYLNTKL